MGSHYTATVQLQRVDDPAPVTDRGGYPIKTIGGAVQMTERKVLDRLRLVVSADTESEAMRQIALVVATIGPKTIEAVDGA